MRLHAESEWFNTGLNRQHVWIALLACAVSLGIHAALLVGLEDVRFGALAAAAPGPEEEAIPTRVVDVIPEEAPVVERPVPLADGMPGVSVKLMEELKAFGVPPVRAPLEPRAIGTEHMTGDAGGLGKPDVKRRPVAWQPRQEIVAIERKITMEELKGFERRMIPDVERVPSAADVVFPFDREAMQRVTNSGRPGAALGVPAAATIESGATEPGTGTRAGGETLKVEKTERTDPARLFEETPEEITPVRPLERRLKATLATYTTSRDREHGYFRLEIERIGEEELPVVPKDLVFVQDCSASITGQRLHFCREGLLKALGTLGPKDRFNVIAFRDKSTRCFPGWACVDAGSLDKARSFIAAMRSEGETDVFASVRELLALERTPGRPLIALVVTDGRPTIGLTQSSDIIAEFTNLNVGRLSVFTLGTIQTANRYLLDLLGYANRGDSTVVASGRWDIRDEIPALVEQVRRPVMGDVRFRFPQGSPLEVYPEMTENLYLDRPLVLYGRYPRGMEAVIFQAVGRAGDVECDMVFDIPLTESLRVRDDTIRDRWATHKIYHLIVEHARGGDPGTLEEIRATSRKYRVRIPYRAEL